jgi:hypothetical protein
MPVFDTKITEAACTLSCTKHDDAPVLVSVYRGGASRKVRALLRATVEEGSN